MKKKIEEFTGKELYEVYLKYPVLDFHGMESVRDYIKANLDTGVDVIGKAPEGAEYYSVFYYDKKLKGLDAMVIGNNSYIPLRPTRPMNRSELVKALEGYAREFSDEDIKAMLAKRGISTEVVE